ncbi:MAG: hypothetical protein HOQ03_03585 [Thermoleophilia bacterium]|nr:hypothetical protein [Thermoleophilia bacterium]
MRGMAGLAVALVLTVGVAQATAAVPKKEPCASLKLAQARAVLGPTVKLTEKKVVRELMCTARVGGAVAATIRSQSANDYDYTVTGLKNEKVLVKQLKAISVGSARGYSYDLWAGSPPSFSQRVIMFRSGRQMYSVDVPARRLLTAAKHLQLARGVLASR